MVKNNLVPWYLEVLVPRGFSGITRNLRIGSSFAYHSSFCTVVVASLEVLSVCICLSISLTRLVRQDYVDQTNQGRDDHKNIRGSLNIFYGLVFAQSISSYMLIPALGLRLDPLVRRVLSEYSLLGWGNVEVSYYTNKKLWAFISNSTIRQALEMDLVTFAMDMVRSDSTDDQLEGALLLDYIIRWEMNTKQLLVAGVHRSYRSTGKKYTGRALTSIRSSTETLEKVVSMLGLDVKSPVEEETRGHAASIVLELAPYVLMENFPAMPHLISSLLLSGCSATHDRDSVELTWYGVKILERLTDNQDNCRPVAEADVLLSKIVGLVKFRDEGETENNTRQDEIVEASLNVLQKLISTTGETGEALRSTISKNVEIVTNIRYILDQHDEQSILFLHSVKILSCLAMHETAREMIGGSCQIIRKLVSSIHPRPNDIGQDFNHGAELANTAMLALVLVSAGSENNKETILEEIDLEVVLESMLSDASMEKRSMVAHLFKHLRTYSGSLYANKLKKVVDGSLPKVLEAIKVEVQKLDDPELPDGQPSDVRGLRAEGAKLLESFIDLGLQICHSMEANDFDKALESANLTKYTYAQMDDTKRLQIPYRRFPGDNE
uniref:Uncharacterized protein n=1 Tax=Oryza brachyantha TaxID=4533 RepID=J3L0K1_ORYBR